MSTPHAFYLCRVWSRYLWHSSIRRRSYFSKQVTLMRKRGYSTGDLVLKVSERIRVAKVDITDSDSCEVDEFLKAPGTRKILKHFYSV